MIQINKWILGLIGIGSVFIILKIRDMNTRLDERLKNKIEELETLQQYMDSIRIHLKEFEENYIEKTDSLSKKIDSLNKKSTQIITIVRPAVDTFRLELPDSLKARFEQIVSNYEHVIELKNIEINTYKEQIRLDKTLDSLKTFTIEQMNIQTKEITEGFKQAVKIARPSLIKRILNKADDVGLIVLILIASK